MPAAWPRGGSEVGVDVDEGRPRNVSRAIELPAALRLAELPATVDELVAQTYQLPLDGGSGTDAGWITYTIPPDADIQASSNWARS